MAQTLYAFTSITHGKGKERITFAPGDEVKALDKDTLKQLVEAGAIVAYDVTAANNPVTLEEDGSTDATASEQTKENPNASGDKPPSE